MNHIKQLSDRELQEMQEKATKFVVLARVDDTIRDVVKISIIEINRELDERKNRKEITK